MSDIDIAIQIYNGLKIEMDVHEKNEPIGLEYDKQDKCHWSWAFRELDDELKVARDSLNKLLDDQLDEYMRQNKVPSKVDNWNKKVACLLLKERLGLHFSVSIRDLFLYVGRSVMCIPHQYKGTVINGFAHTLDEWANADIDAVREGVANIGFRMEERCYHCNELMPDFQGSGHAVCSDCI